MALDLGLVKVALDLEGMLPLLMVVPLPLLLYAAKMGAGSTSSNRWN